MASCDVQATFITVSCTNSGSMNDIIAWQDTNIYEMLEIECQLPEKDFLIRDEAFTITFQYLIPWSG
jgi:hypothetical protein